MREKQKAYYRTSSYYVEAKQKLLGESKAQEQLMDKKLAIKKVKLKAKIQAILAPTLNL